MRIQQNLLYFGRNYERASGITSPVFVSPVVADGIQERAEANIARYEAMVAIEGPDTPREVIETRQRLGVEAINQEAIAKAIYTAIK